MTERNTGGPAFPGKDGWDVWHEGMTLRDYFAAKAMQGLFSDTKYRSYNSDKAIAERAYQAADAMLEARK